MKTLKSPQKLKFLCAFILPLIISACGGGGGGSPSSINDAALAPTNTTALPIDGSSHSQDPSPVSDGGNFMPLKLDNGLTISQTKTSYGQLFQAYDGIYGSNYTPDNSEVGSDLLKLNNDGTTTLIASYPKDASTSGALDIQAGTGFITPSDDGGIWYYKNTGSSYAVRTVSTDGALSPNIISSFDNGSYIDHNIQHNAIGDIFNIIGKINGSSRDGIDHHGYFYVDLRDSAGVMKASDIFTSSSFYEANFGGPYGSIYSGVDGKLYIAASTRSLAEVNNFASSNLQLFRLDLNGNTENIVDITSLSASTCFTSPNNIIGPDGNLLSICGGAIETYDYQTGARIRSIPIAGFVPQYPPGAGPIRPNFGPDGNVWFHNGSKFYAVNPNTGVVIYSGPLDLVNNYSVNKFMTGSDGKLWIPVDLKGGTSTALYVISGLAIPVPTNDNFANAVALSGNSGTVSGLPFKATAQADEPAHLGRPAQKSLWWTWTAPANGRLTLNTHGSYPAAGVAVYTGTGLASLEAVTDATRTAKGYATIPVTVGATYKIAVDNPYSNGVIDILSYQFKAD